MKAQTYKSFEQQNMHEVVFLQPNYCIISYICEFLLRYVNNNTSFKGSKYREIYQSTDMPCIPSLFK